MKQCLVCLERKPFSSFYKDNRRKDGYGIYCKGCWSDKYCSTDEQKKSRRLAVKKHWDAKSGTVEFKEQRRTNQLRALYKLSREQYQIMLDSQNNQCAICECNFSESVVPVVDHDHNCCHGQRSCGGCLRALLCGSCNMALGGFKDNPDTLDKASAYVRSFQSIKHNL